MAERGPLAEVNTNVMAQGAPSSLGKVALPDESLLSGKDAVRGEGSKLFSGHATLNSFLPQTVQLKREDRDDHHREIDIEVDEHGVCSEESDTEIERDDDQFPGDSWKEKAEKPAIVRNLLCQNKEASHTDINIDSYPRSSLKVLTALGLEFGCGDPLVAANLLPG